jgi:predicted nucleotidyltransferase
MIKHNSKARNKKRFKELQELFKEIEGETFKERVLRFMKISPTKKMEWLRLVNEFTPPSKKTQFLRQRTKENKNLFLKNRYVNMLKKSVLTTLKNEKIKIILFGSRARGQSYEFSDIDIGLIPYGKYDEFKITLLKDKIEDLNIPYKVDVVNFKYVSENFKKQALKEAIIWKD